MTVVMDEYKAILTENKRMAKTLQNAKDIVIGNCQIMSSHKA